MTKEQLVNFMDWLDSKGYAKDFCTAHDYIAQVYLDQMNQQTGTNTLVMESLPPPQTTFWPCPNCSKETSETKWLCCCSQQCCKEYMDKHKQLSSGNAP